MYWRILIGSLRRRRGRVALAFLALFAAAVTTATLATVTADLSARAYRELARFGANALLLPREERVLAEEALARARRPPVEAAAALLLLPARCQDRPVTAVGVDGPDFQRLEPAAVEAGRMPAGPEEALVGADLVSGRPEAIGGAITLHLEGRPPRTFAISGVLPSGAGRGRWVVVDRSGLRAWAGDAPPLNRIALRVPPDQMDAAARAAGTHLPEAAFTPIRRVAGTEGRVLARTRGLMWLTAALVVGLSGLCFTSTIWTLHMERRGETGLFAALGASRYNIALLLAGELALLALAAVVPGVLAGQGLAAVIVRHSFQAAPEFHWSIWPLTLGLVAALALVGSAAPTLRALRLPVAHVLKGME